MAKTYHFMKHTDSFVFILPIRAVWLVITEGMIVYAPVDPVPIWGWAGK